MFNLWLELSLSLRIALLGLLGLVGGAFANYAIYCWAWFPRPISPWARKPADASPRTFKDYLPVFGWLSLRREASIHGNGFWVRPLLIELSMAIAIPLLYCFETQWGGLLPEAARVPTFLDGPVIISWGHRIFLGHCVLFVLMVASTFIDFDEQTIPDLITIPGTLFALLLGSISYWGFLPVSVPVGESPMSLETATFNAPWFPADSKWWTSTGLLTGLAIWSGWCFALADRRLILRRGIAKAIGFFCAALVRHPSWKVLLGMWIIGCIGIAIVFDLGGVHWHGLLTALIGLAVGGGVVWAIRIVASWAMRREAMGFGDVTLMAMIGAFIGWQGAVIAFFLAPFAAIAIVIVQFIVTREPAIPFGPYLCAGTVLSIYFWDDIANGWLLPNVFFLGSFLLWLSIAMLGLMAVMLFISRMVRTMLG